MTEEQRNTQHTFLLPLQGGCQVRRWRRAGQPDLKVMGWREGFAWSHIGERVSAAKRRRLIGREEARRIVEAELCAWRRSLVSDAKRGQIGK